MLYKIIGYIVCFGYLIIKFPSTKSRNEIDYSSTGSSTDSTDSTDSTNSTNSADLTQVDQLKLDEIEALDVLIATLSQQEKNLRLRAQAAIDDAIKYKLDVQAAKVHLQIIKYSNKAVKLWEEIEK